MSDAASRASPTPGARPQDVVPTAHAVGPRKKWHCASGCMAMVGSKGESCEDCESDPALRSDHRRKWPCTTKGCTNLVAHPAKPCDYCWQAMAAGRCVASGCEKEAVGGGAFCGAHEAEVPERPAAIGHPCLGGCGARMTWKATTCAACEAERKDHLAERFAPDGTLPPTPAASLRSVPETDDDEAGYVVGRLEDVVDDLERLCRHPGAQEATRIALRALFREAAKVLGRVEAIEEGH